jgi:hypothetical protein
MRVDQMSYNEGQWFVITDGEFAGRPHLVGWTLSAIQGQGWAPSGDDGWFAFGHCPRCHAMVATDEKRLQDNQWAHEAWHAATDFPMPYDVARAATEWEKAR